jgi:hypothetical protein
MRSCAGLTDSALHAAAETRANHGGVSQFRPAPSNKQREKIPSRISAMAFRPRNFLNSGRAAN